jgi:hypothetical protein
MTLRRAIATVFGSTLVITTIGTCLGYALAKLTPDYYRIVFSEGRDPDFDPVSIGIGLGLTQGFVGGLVVGLILVALLRIKYTPDHYDFPSPQKDVIAKVRKSATKHLLLVTGALFLIGFCLLVAGGIGIGIGERNAYHRQCLEERKVITPILMGDPAFVKVTMFDDIGVMLFGEVATQDDLNRLRTKLTNAIGEKRTSEAMSGVSVKR